MRESVSVPNSLILIMDPENTSVPVIDRGLLIGANSGCIAVGTLCELDGVTSIDLVRRSSGDETAPPTFAKAHEQVLTLTSRVLAVCPIVGVPYLSIEVPTSRVSVEVYVDDPSEPENIRIVWDLEDQEVNRPES